MYTLFQLLSPRSMFLEQVTTIGISLIIAEILYKFHSFTLECLAFLATWYVLDGVRNFISVRLRNRSWE